MTTETKTEKLIETLGEIRVLTAHEAIGLAMLLDAMSRSKHKSKKLRKDLQQTIYGLYGTVCHRLKDVGMNLDEWKELNRQIQEDMSK